MLIEKLERRMCAFCGKEYLRDSRWNGYKFCSVECRREARNERRRNA